MVINHNFQDLYESLNEMNALNLPTLKENTLKIIFADSHDCRTVYYKGQDPPLPFAASKVAHASIHSSRRLTAVDEKCKTVYEISFDVTGSNLNFRPGDTIGVIPVNNQSEVDVVIQHLKLEDVVDYNYTLNVDSSLKAKIPPHIPVQSTLRHVLTCCVDLRGVLKKLFLLALSRHTNDENEKRILEYLCSKEGSLAYTTYIINKHICLPDIFSVFKTCKPPVEIILEHLPRLLPRPYSIVNSKNCDKNIITICFSVTDIGNNRKGLTTGWLEDILIKHDSGKTCSIEEKIKNISINNHMQSEIPIYLRNNMNNFHLPENLEIPIILIGPGTGVSPFIGFLQERRHLQRNNQDTKLGFAWLFFGCRNPKLDFIYEKELNEFVTEGILDKLTTSFSRCSNSETCYVQDAIKQNGEAVAKLILQGAYVYVCGEINKMAGSVRDAIVHCVATYGEKEHDAEGFVADMINEKKYILDVWN